MDQRSDSVATVGGGRLPVLGYSDRLSVTPGDTITFMVSCLSETYTAEVLRVTGGGPRPELGVSCPVQTESVPGSRATQYAGQTQCLVSGSFLEYGPLADSCADFTFVTWVLPTLPVAGRPQAIFANVGSKRSSGLSLGLTSEGHLQMVIGGWHSAGWRITLPEPVRSGSWYRVGMSVDSRGDVILGQRQTTPRSQGGDPIIVEGSSVATRGMERGSWISVGAIGNGNGLQPSLAGIRPGAFNGKVASPHLSSGSADRSRMEMLLGANPRDLSPSMLSWPAPSAQSGGGPAPSGLQPMLFNSPLRAVTGPNWDGRHLDWRLVPQEYDAIRFHEDDLDDANWSPSFTWTVPVDTPCGLYCSRLSTTDGEDVVPFFVRPRFGKPTAPVAFLAPVYTYLAYSNSDYSDATKIAGVSEPHVLTERERVVNEHPEIGRSLYDQHPDGSGIAHVSWRRPMVDLRLDHSLWTKGGSGGAQRRSLPH